MSDQMFASKPIDDIVGSRFLLFALACGAFLGIAAKLIGSLGRSFKSAGAPLVMLGMGTAVWVTVGFLIARRSAKDRTLLDGTVWAGTTMAVYLSVWLLSYTITFGLQQDGGFAAAWLNERAYFIVAPPVSAILGLVATLSWRHGWLGDVCITMPVAWSLPEVIRSLSMGWQHLLVVGLPALALASIPLATAHRLTNKKILLLTLCLGGTIAFLFLRVVSNGKI